MRFLVYSKRKKSRRSCWRRCAIYSRAQIINPRIHPYHTQCKARLQRLHFGPVVRNRCKALYEWLRAGNRDWRAKFLRALAVVDGDTPDDEPIKDKNELVASMAVALVTSLVRYSDGKKSTENNKYGFFPYGKGAAFSTTEFLAVPTPWFAVTLAGMYPYVTKDKDDWTSLIEKFQHPVTSLWPWSTVRRYISFATKFRVRGVGRIIINVLCDAV